MEGAVAVDLGATSGRFAAGRLVDGRIEFEVIEQTPNAPVERNGRLEWRLNELLALCRRAADYAAHRFERATLGIDSWGVDHGFLDADGAPLGNPVCYRDRSHARAFERLAPAREQLYALTGIQHQPFNTLFQLVARREEDPSLSERARWLMLPDFLGRLLGGRENMELTQASTTQLLGLDGHWAGEAFAIAGWPIPPIEPTRPGRRLGEVAPGVELVSVGSHDTASAVAGFGELRPEQIFLNVGTWSLAGCLVPEPIATPAAEAANFTNERAVTGEVRLLKNIPGFFVLNRLHEELGIATSVPEWLRAGRLETDERIDLLDSALFNPASMVEAVSRGLRKPPSSPEAWSGLALASLTAAIAKLPGELSALTGRRFESIRVGGGGSQSEEFCRSLAAATNLTVLAGPAEATVLGNLAVQFLASGQVEGQAEMCEVVARSAQVRRYGSG